MPSHLPLITLYLSERCNSRCVSCDYWKHGTVDMQLAEILRLLPELRELGTRSVLISGGEPLLNPDWPEIAETLVNNGLDLWLLTSGLSLAKHSGRVASLFKSVTVSLDGACASTYAAIRGVDAFDKVCEGIRNTATAGVPTSIRVTLQKANFRELADFVRLARELGASQVSFLAVDIGHPHAFARRADPALKLALDANESAEFAALIDVLEADEASSFRSGLIAETPEKLRRIKNYFLALDGRRPFPPVRCNAPEFSAVIAADGSVSPCFFIAGPADSPRAPALRKALESADMQELRASIQSQARPECARCVCSMWRDPETVAEAGFELPSASHG